MKKIRIKICSHDDKNPFSYGHFFLSILRKYYEVEFSEEPDYVFYNESTYEHLEYDCVKIFYTGENIYPNFNFCDYAIGFDYLSFGDRFFRLPVYLLATVYQPKELEQAKEIDFTKQLFLTKEDLKRKTGFCSFVYSNYMADDQRKIIFDKLSTYKKVDAGGKYLNNIGERVDNKLAFEKEHKFSIAFENSSRTGYTTEKLVTSIMAQTIPIYWGNPDIHKEFNDKRFVNCHKYGSFDEVLERVKEIDNNDELYLRIINEPVTIPSHDFEKVLREFEAFLRDIFDQPLTKAKRIGLGHTRASLLKRRELEAARIAKLHNGVIKILSTLYKPFKRIKGLEKLKETYFKKLK